MDNTVVVAIYAPFAVITAIIVIINLFKRFNRRDHYYFMLICLCLVCWFISRISGIMANTVELAKFFINLSIICIGFMPPLLFLMVIAFYRVSLKKPYITTVLLFLIPVINIVVTLTARYHKLMFNQLEIVTLAPIREVVLEWGPWFWVHTCYSYMLSIMIIVIILVLHFRIPKFYRTPSTMIVISLLVTLSGNAATLLQIFPLTMDPTLIVMSLALILFELAIFSNSDSKFVRFSRGQVFQYIREYILILDENQRIVDYNNLALNWFSERKIVLSAAFFEDVMVELLNNEKITMKGLDGGNENDIYLNDGIFPTVLNLRIEEMTGATGDKIGSIAIFTDVTENRLLIERLEAKAGMDALTGIANRMAYEGAEKRLNNPEFFPLSVIMCDANRLKHVNDTFGHKYGDMMLQMIADILVEVCPPQSFMARIGGDEFIILLPRTLPEEAERLMEEIRSMSFEYKNTPFVVSLALGTATKYSETENLVDVIALADSNMYEDKKKRKDKYILSYLRPISS